MLMTEIKRGIVTVAGTDEMSLALGREAAELLGYSVLGIEQENDDAGPIARVLSELGIDTLNSQDVLQYKHEQRLELARRTFESWCADPARKEERSWDRYNCPEWELTEIAKYKERIPEHVLNKAVQIKRACPDASLLICHLTESPDPFLVVQTATANAWSDPKERGYVEVWDDPKFEGRVR